jgi:hypothetical protein
MQKAQGTIEYLIIIAIVIVIGLIIATMSTSMFNQTQIIQTSDNLKGQIGVGGISIKDTIADYTETGLINIKNNSGETITLTKITTTSGENEYEKPITQGNTQLIQTNNLCQCEPNQTTKTCTYNIYYETRHGLEKKITQTITVNCQDNITITDNTTTPNPTPDGTLENPWRITTCIELQDMNKNLDGNYILGNDIDCGLDTNNSGGALYNGGLGFSPIGDG